MYAEFSIKPNNLITINLSSLFQNHKTIQIKQFPLISPLIMQHWRTFSLFEVSVIIFLKDLSISSNFFASSGNWSLMSPPTKMPSRYSHFFCSCTHNSITSEIVCIVTSQFCTVLRKGPMNWEAAMPFTFIMLSSRIWFNSSIGPKMNPRSSVPKNRAFRITSFKFSPHIILEVSYKARFYVDLFFNFLF